jgi:hypothetical protein
MKFYAGIGSRKTPPEVLRAMTSIARTLDAAGYILRSGAAEGADSAFEAGADPKRKEIWLPWHGFNMHTSPLLPSPEAFVLAAEVHPAWTRLSRGARALHARNGCQILGADLRTPVDFVVCWTPEGDGSGGTGQALRLAVRNGIPIFDLGLGDLPLQALKEHVHANWEPDLTLETDQGSFPEFRT